jgi:DNA repair exonuclease SbcCD ATPase subunit
VCSNEKEVEALLKDLLPPKEVVLSANFLMQDAVNIFELAPAERLDIFKHMFGFIGIDHAKDVLRDKRKEVQTRITVIQDMSDLQRQSETLLESLISEIRYMKHISLKHSELATPLQPFLHQ